MAGIALTWSPLWPRGRASPTRSDGAAETPGATPLLALAGTSAGTLVWWLLVAKEVWIRHALPSVLLATVVVAVVTGVFVRSTLARRDRGARVAAVVAASLTCLLVVPVVVRTHGALAPPGPSLASQRRAAAALDREPRRATHVQWSQNPELMFLTGRVSHPHGHPGDVLIVPDLDAVVTPWWHAVALHQCGHVLLHADGYRFCEVRPRAR
jgi:hypothetical protein